MKFINLKTVWLLIIIFVAAACQPVEEIETPPPTQVVPAATGTAQATGKAQATATLVQPTPSSTPEIPTPTNTPFLPTPTIPPTETIAPAPIDLSIKEEDVRLFPMPGIYSGDLVTFQVQPFVPDDVIVTNVKVDISVDDQIISSDTLDWRNWAGNASGIYEWVWDTTGLPGAHEIRVTLDTMDEIKEGDEDPANNEVIFEVNVAKAGERPLAERDAAWITGETECCTVYALTRTAAYRDFPELLEMVDTAVAQAVHQLDEDPHEKLDVYFVDRNIGQGGYAGSELVVSYMDRQYSGGSLHQLLVHEAVHVLDRQFAPQRTKFLAEGVAVWASGGHYKQENLHQRAAALLQIGEYIPLTELVADFYPQQHEIGYLEAGAFVSYLIDEYGWPTFREFYSNTSADDGPTDVEAMDVNFQAYYEKTFKDLETEWIGFLSELPIDPNENEDVQTTIRFYDVMRDYQEAYDPSAHFLFAWLPQPHEVREIGNPADFVRHPEREINIILELMLQDAESALRDGNYALTNVILNSIEKILDQDGAYTDPLSVNYRDVVRTATNFGYEVQDVDFTGESAVVVATTASGIHLTNLNMELQHGDWILLTN